MSVILSDAGQLLVKDWERIRSQSGPRPEYYPPGSVNLDIFAPIPVWSYAVDLLLFLADPVRPPPPALSKRYEAQLHGVYFFVRRRLGFSYFQAALAFEALVNKGCIQGVTDKWRSRELRTRELLAALGQKTRFKIFQLLCGPSFTPYPGQSAIAIGTTLGISPELARHHAKVLAAAHWLRASDSDLGLTYEADPWTVLFLSQSLRLMVGLPRSGGGL